MSAHPAAKRMISGLAHADDVALAQQLPLKVICGSCGKEFAGPLALGREWWRAHAATHHIDLDLAARRLKARRATMPRNGAA